MIMAENFRKSQTLSRSIFFDPGTDNHSLPVTCQVSTSAAQPSQVHHGAFVFQQSSETMQEHFWVLGMKPVSTWCCQKRMKRSLSQRSQGYTIYPLVRQGFSDSIVSEQFRTLQINWTNMGFPSFSNAALQRIIRPLRAFSCSYNVSCSVLLALWKTSKPNLGS